MSRRLSKDNQESFRKWFPRKGQIVYINGTGNFPDNYHFKILKKDSTTGELVLKLVDIWPCI